MRPTRFVLVASAVCLLGASELRLVGFLFVGAARYLGIILCCGLLLALFALLKRDHAWDTVITPTEADAPRG